VKRKLLLLTLGFVLFLSLFASAKTNLVFAGEGHGTPTPVSTRFVVSLTPSQRATATSIIEFSPTATQVVDSNAQAQFQQIQDGLAELKKYVETPQPDNSQIQKRLEAIGNSLDAAEEQAKIDKLKQNTLGWIQFAIGLILGALLGWVNIEPPLPPIRRDLIKKTMFKFLNIGEQKNPQKSVDMKTKQRKRRDKKNKAG